MNEVTFRDKICALREYYLQDIINVNRNEDFWYIMDSINDDLVIKWAERVTKIKDPIHGHWDTQEWQQLCYIINYFKNYDAQNEMPWTKKQKRFCTWMIVKYWDDLEMMYYC